MKKIMSILLSAVTCLSFAGCGINSVDNIEEKALNAVSGYKSGKEFVIKGWLTPNTNTYESYKLARDAGITHIMIDSGTNLQEYGSQQFNDVMGYMQELGLNGIYTLGNGGRTTDLYDGMDKNFTDYPAIKGVNYFDEPFERAQNNAIYNVIAAHEAKYDDELFAYTNLLPYHAFGDTYDSYVENYCKDVLSKIQGRKILSMDVYPYYNGDKLIESTWLAGLETIGKNARDYGLEMQIWIQSMENLALGSGSLRKPIKEEYAHQIYAALAFGAKGIGYFTLGTGLAPGWGEALITKDGKASESYYWAKEVNAEICSFQDAYLSFNWEKALAVDGTQAENQCINFMFMDKRPALDKVQNISATEDAIIGQFDNGGKKAYIIANFAEPMTKKENTVEMTFEGANAIVVYAKGERKVFRLIDGKAVFSLGVGEGVFAIPVTV